MGVTKKSFGKSPEGKDVFLYELKNENGMAASVTDFGAKLVKLRLKRTE